MSASSPLRSLSSPPPSPARRSPNQSPMREHLTEKETNPLYHKISASIARLQPFSQNYFASKVIEKLNEILSRNSIENDGFTTYEEAMFDEMTPFVEEIVESSPTERPLLTLDKIKSSLSRFNLYFDFNEAQSVDYLSSIVDKNTPFLRPSRDAKYLTVTFFHKKRFSHVRLRTQALCQFRTIFEITAFMESQVAAYIARTTLDEQTIMVREAFHGTITRKEAESRLLPNEWLIRYSENLKAHVLSFKNDVDSFHIPLNSPTSDTIVNSILTEYKILHPQKKSFAIYQKEKPIKEHPAFHGTVTSQEAESRLYPNEYIIRYSETQKDYVLTFNKEGQCFHVLLKVLTSDKTLDETMTEEHISHFKMLPYITYQNYQGLFTPYTAFRSRT